LLGTLYPHYEHIGEIRYNQQDFVCAFFGNTVNETDGWKFLDKKQFLNKVFNGDEPLPLANARYIHSHKDEVKLEIYLNNRPTETILKLCDDFEVYFGRTLREDIVNKIVKTFYEIVDDIKNKRTHTRVAVKPTYIEETTANECLAIIINALSKITNEKLDASVKLRLDPQPIEDKINESNVVLRKEIINHFYDYYSFINGLITEACKTNSAFGRKMTEAVQNISDNYIKRGTYTQEQIVSLIAGWIKNITTLVDIDDQYFRILVAYFVQNCEVFHNESSK
jgi:hypothetical protein